MIDNVASLVSHKWNEQVQSLSADERVSFLNQFLKLERQQAADSHGSLSNVVALPRLKAVSLETPYKAEKVLRLVK